MSLEATTTRWTTKHCSPIWLVLHRQMLHARPVHSSLDTVVATHWQRRMRPLAERRCCHSSDVTVATCRCYATRSARLFFLTGCHCCRGLPGATSSCRPSLRACHLRFASLLNNDSSSASCSLANYTCPSCARSSSPSAEPSVVLFLVIFRTE